MSLISGFSNDMHVFKNFLSFYYLVANKIVFEFRFYSDISSSLFNLFCQRIKQKNTTKNSRISFINLISLSSTFINRELKFCVKEPTISLFLHMDKLFHIEQRYELFSTVLKPSIPALFKSKKFEDAELRIFQISKKKTWKKAYGEDMEENKGKILKKKTCDKYT